MQIDGKKLKKLREAQFLTQEKLAEKSSVDVRVIRVIENNDGHKVQARTAEALAGTLRTQAENLLKEEPASPSRAGIMPPLPDLVIGRERHVRDFKARLMRRRAGRAGVNRLVIRGLPGVGKTTMARLLAHDPDLKRAFPDATLWASLGQSPDLYRELRNWCRALGIFISPTGGNLGEACDRLAAALHDREALLLVDDIWQVEHGSVLCVGGESCAMVMTTRDTEVARNLSPTPDCTYLLDLLEEDDALELLRRLAPAVVKAHEQAARELVRTVERLPLALQVAGRLLEAESKLGWGVEDLMGQLKNTARLLGEKLPSPLVQQTTPTVAAVFQTSVDALDAQARKCFAYLAPSAPKPAVFDLEYLTDEWAGEVADVKDMARLLVNRGLLEPVGPGRFQMHYLLVLYAQSLPA